MRISRIVNFFAKVYFAKFLKMVIRESLSREYFSTFRFGKVYPVKISWFFEFFSYQPKFLKKHFLVQIHYYFCIFPCTEDFREFIVKGTLMQIWKSTYMFMFIKKQYPEKFAFLTLRTLKLFAREVCKFLKK